MKTVTIDMESIMRTHTNTHRQYSSNDHTDTHHHPGREQIMGLHTHHRHQTGHVHAIAARRQGGLWRATGLCLLVLYTLWPAPAHAQPRRAPQSDVARRFDAAARRDFVNALPQADQHRAIHLKARAFLPTADFDVAQITHRQHVYVQFSTVPAADERTQLLEQGIELREYVANRTFVAYADADALATLQAHALVSGLAAIDAVDKMPAGVWHRMQRPGTGPPAIHRYRVRLHAGVVPADVAAALTAMGIAGDAVEHGSDIAFEADLTDAQVAAVATLDDVSAVALATPPRIEYNDHVQVYTRSSIAHAAPYGLDGSGVTVLIRDGNYPQHTDFNSRRTVLDNRYADPSEHHTHVTGTVIGSGAGNSRARGMAPAASVVTHDFYGNDTPEVRDPIVNHNAKLSNHSYGVPYGWGWSRDSNGNWIHVYYDYTGYEFGNYNALSNEWDALVYDYDAIIVRAAGNPRNDPNWSGQSHRHESNGQWYTDSHPANGPYNCINSAALAKNVITVGAVDHDNSMSSFSAFGPPEDGRVKPDVVSDGVGVFSTVPGNQYDSMDGTSMASPATTGALALFLEYYRDQVGGGTTLPSAAVTKACLIHGARDLTQAHGTFYQVGPDYASGYGAVDVVNSIDALDGLVTDSVANAQTDQFTLTVSDTTTPVRVTLVWIDPAGNTAATMALVNNLDLAVTGPNGAVYRPWVLNRTHPAAAATRGINTVDTVEQVVIPNPQAGQYTVAVQGTSVPQGPQQYALVMSAAPEVSTPPPASGCSLHVTYPNGGEQIVRGRSVTLQWTGNVPGNRVKLLLKKGKDKPRVIAGDVASTGSYTLTVPAGLPLGRNYKFIVMSTTDKTCRDISDAAFSIVDASCTLQVTSPNGGEQLERGRSVTLRWSGEVPGDRVTLILRKGRRKQVRIAADVPNTGSYSVTVPNWLPEGHNYRLLVHSTANKMCRGISNGTFSILQHVPNPCTLQVSSPNGGELFEHGQAVQLRWTGSSPTNAVSVKILKGGVVQRALGTNLANTGSLNWTVPADLPVGTDYRLLVRASDDTCQDQSDATFSIVVPQEPCSVQVAYPNGGEQLERGQTVNVTWTGAVPGDQVYVLLVKGNLLQQTLGNGVPNTGSLSWTVSQNLPLGNDYRIRVRSVSDNGCFDLSNAAFSIIDPAPVCDLHVTSPNGGEVYERGQTVQLTWTGGGSQVVVSAYRQSSDARAAGLVANTGSYTWTISDYQELGSDYVFTVMSPNGSCADSSDATFSIVDPAPVCDLQVTNPNGGEFHYTTTYMLIEWTGNSSAQTVTVMLLKGAIPVQSFDATNSGRVAMYLPDTLATGADYRVRISTPDNACADVSDAPFTIYNAPSQDR